MIYQKVWTTYLSYPKSKPKITPFTEVIRVRILWPGLVDEFSTLSRLGVIDEVRIRLTVLDVTVGDGLLAQE
jgi:hypothetical protein